MEEKMDMADHLIAAAKLASREGLTKEKYQHAASIFWDSWHDVQEFMKEKESENEPT